MARSYSERDNYSPNGNFNFGIPESRGVVNSSRRMPRIFFEYCVQATIKALAKCDNAEDRGKFTDMLVRHTKALNALRYIDIQRAGGTEPEEYLSLMEELVQTLPAFYKKATNRGGELVHFEAEFQNAQANEARDTKIDDFNNYYVAWLEQQSQDLRDYLAISQVLYPGENNHDAFMSSLDTGKVDGICDKVIQP